MKQRLSDLEAVSNAQMLMSLPGRWHELRANRAGQMSGDLNHPQRLIIEPADPGAVRRPDGGVNWASVTHIVVVEIADTHG